MYVYLCMYKITFFLLNQMAIKYRRWASIPTTPTWNLNFWRKEILSRTTVTKPVLGFCSKFRLISLPEVCEYVYTAVQGH